MSKKKSKNKKTQKVTTKQLNTAWLPSALFIAAGILIFYPPFFQGLFFPREMFITHILTALVFAGVWVNKMINRDYTFLKTPLDWAVLAYAAAYLLSLIGAVHIGEAIYGFLKALNYFMIYWIITQLVKNYKDYENILRILLAAGIGVAVIGILAATGYSDYPGAFAGRHVNSTLQYANANAAYMAIISIIGVTLWIKEQNTMMKFIYGISTYLLILVSLAALSKGAWLIFVIGLILLIIFMPGRYKLKAIYSLGLAAFAAGATAAVFIPAITGEANSDALPLGLIGIIIIMVGQGFWELVKIIRYKKGIRFVVALVILVCIAAAGIAGSMFSVNTDNGRTDLIAQELSGLTDVASSSFSSRVDLNRWAMAIVKDYPVFGAGAGGWNALYHQYQDRLIWATETHNHFLQVWVEAGTIGIIAFLGIWGMSLLGLYRIYQLRKLENTEEKIKQQVLIIGSSTAALALGMHALIDFDLSMPALAILLAVLFAVLNSAGSIEQIENKSEYIKKPVINIVLASVMALLLLICGSSYALGDNYARKGQDSIDKMLAAQTAEEKSDELAKAQSFYQTAVNRDSCNAEYHTNMAQINAIIFDYLKQSNPALAKEYRNSALAELEKSYQLAPYDIKARGGGLNISAQLGDIDEMVKQARAALTANPWDNNAYNAAAGALWAGAEYYLQQEDYSKSSACANELPGLQDQIQKQLDKLERSGCTSQKSKLALSFDSRLNIGKAYYILGDYEKAESNLEPMINNLLAMEFTDVSFENTEFDNENWRVTVVEDEEASSGKCLEITAKKDMHGWPAVISLASKIPIIPEIQYVAEARYKILSCGNSSGGEEGACIGIWGTTIGDEKSINTSFALYKGEKISADPSSWQIEQRLQNYEEGLQKRNFRIGTGSVCKGTQFRIDYVAFYPSDIANLPENMKTASIYYAAALKQQGKEQEALQIIDGLQGDVKLIELYNQLNRISN